MVIRLLLSLAFVAGVLWFAVRLARKRGLGSSGGLVEVVAHQRMGRASTVNVLRIGDRVLVVGATEQQVTLLAELDGEALGATLAERADGEDRPALTAAPGSAGGVLAGSVLDRSAWTGLVGQLRERTVRR
ncbi:MAG TPA: flagellar biosynthetic protein FliO [Geodermatophilus sp.]|nr:flagellar biosynthetic protein FliO [Geodermatophilus sp.]